MPSESSVTSDNYLTLPIWLNISFLEKVLIRYYKDDTIKIQNFSVKPATAKGDNYASSMFRVHITYSGEVTVRKTESMIVKTTNEEGVGRDLLSQLNVYNKEVEMYDKILPQLTALMKNANYTEELFANAIDVSYEYSAIVFEDLSVKGYKMPVLGDGLDVHTAKIILNKLAKFHAAAAVLYENQPSVYKNFRNGMLNRETESFENFYKNSWDVLTSQVLEWNNYEYYGNKLKKLKSKFIENGKRAIDPKPHHFKTLIHGDMWSNNTMFKYGQANDPEEMVLIDFQFGVYTSPTIDLHYFLNTCLLHDVRMNNVNELIQYYHLILSSTLEDLNYQKNIPTLHEIQVQYLETMFHGLISSFIQKPIMINKISTDADIDSLMNDNERARSYKKLIYANNEVHKYLKEILPIYDQKGLLD